MTKMSINSGYCTKLLKFNNDLVICGISTGELYSWDLLSNKFEKKTSELSGSITSLAVFSSLIQSGNIAGSVSFRDTDRNYEKVLPDAQTAGRAQINSLAPFMAKVPIVIASQDVGAALVFIQNG